MTRSTSATSGATAARPAVERRPAPTVAAQRIELDGTRGAHVSRCARPAGASTCRLPLPGLYNVYNALGAAALCLALGASPAIRSPRAWQRSAAAFGRAETVTDRRPRAGDPADQEPRRRQRDPPHAGPRGRTSSTCSAILNDRTADGRDVSWVWDADFEMLRRPRAARHLRGHARGRAGAAAASTRGFRSTACRSSPALPHGARRRLWRRRATGGCSRCPPTRRCSSCATSSRARGHVAQFWSSAPRQVAVVSVIWHDLECGAYAEDLPLWRALAGAVRRPGARRRRGHRPRRARPRPRGHRVTALDSDPALLAELRAPRRRPGRGHRARPTPATFELGTTLPALPRPDADDPAARRARGRAALPAPARARTSAPAASWRSRSPTSSSRSSCPTARPRPLPDICELDGVVYSSQPDAVRAEARRLRARAPARDRRPPTARSIGEQDRIRLDRLTAARARARGAGGRAARAAGRTRDRRRPPTTSAARW